MTNQTISNNHEGLSEMTRAKQPLAEVFGYPPGNFSTSANRFRDNRLCPFNNIVPNCTKSRVENPIGVCSIYGDNGPVIVCPVRFREEWLVASDAAKYFFPQGSFWTSLTEVRLPDKHGCSAGNIDVVLVSYDDRGRLLDYGALEVQAVYISGNISAPFQHFMDNPQDNHQMDWSRHSKYPRADYLSSSRKRLAPQLIYKGGILHSWGRKTAVALDRGFYSTLPVLDEVPADRAEMAWFIYDLIFDEATKRYKLTLSETKYTSFETALTKITRSEAGDEKQFIAHLQGRLDSKLENKTPSEVGTVESPF